MAYLMSIYGRFQRESEWLDIDEQHQRWKVELKVEDR